MIESKSLGFNFSCPTFPLLECEFLYCRETTEDLKKKKFNYYLQINLSSLKFGILLFFFKRNYHCWSHELLQINANVNLSDCCWCNYIKYRYLVCVLTIRYWYFLNVQATRSQYTYFVHSPVVPFNFAKGPSGLALFSLMLCGACEGHKLLKTG